MKTHSDELALYVAVVEAGSFRQAAEALGIDNSVVSRGVKRLEEKLSTILLHRTTRRLTLTTEGEWYYQRAQQVLSDMAAAEENLLARQSQPEGVLKVDAATPFIIHQLVPLIGEFRRRYPAIELQLESSESFINLLERRVDMAIRIGELSDSSLRALPLGLEHWPGIWKILATRNCLPMMAQQTVYRMHLPLTPVPRMMSSP